MIVTRPAIGAAVARHGRRCTDTAAWPWMIGVIETAVANGEIALPDAVIGAVLHGPPQLSRAARAAVHDADRAVVPGPAPAACAPRGDRELTALRGRLGTARGDRLCGTVAAVGRSGEPPDLALARLRSLEAAAQAGLDDIGRRAGIGRAGRWLLLAPLAPVALGVLPGVAGWVVTVLAAAAWGLAGPWVSAADHPRVFAHEPLDRRP